MIYWVIFIDNQQIDSVYGTFKHFLHVLSLAQEKHTLVLFLT